jgi:hypothetical protein
MHFCIPCVLNCPVDLQLLRHHGESQEDATSPRAQRHNHRECRQCSGQVFIFSMEHLILQRNCIRNEEDGSDQLLDAGSAHKIKRRWILNKLIAFTQQR